MQKIIECVPNISEGRDKEKVRRIAETVKISGVKLLDIHIGESANRSVITFAGEPEAVKEAAFLLIQEASKLIDMRHHKGVHPRIGAVDVCPFVPILGASMKECVDISRSVAKRVALELSIPVYLYEHSATSLERASLPYLRKGGYEKLSQRISAGFTPDYGEPLFNPKFGALITGARDILVAYNISLDTDSPIIPSRIAEVIRESGADKTPGKFKKLRAIGWYIKEYSHSQVSMNILDFREAKIHLIFEYVKKLAYDYGVNVIGSELIGLIPKDCLLEAGEYFLSLSKAPHPYTPDEKTISAIKGLMLNSRTEFNPSKKILEEAIHSLQ